MSCCRCAQGVSRFVRATWTALTNVGEDEVVHVALPQVVGDGVLVDLDGGSDESGGRDSNDHDEGSVEAQRALSWRTFEMSTMSSTPELCCFAFDCQCGGCGVEADEGSEKRGGRGRGG